jgi:hypothetical protein
MSWGSDAAKSFDSGFASGAAIKEKRKKNKIAEILSANYEQPVEAMTAPEGISDFLVPNYDPVGKPGGLNMQNALAQMYREGLGPEAMALEQQMTKQEDWGSPQAVVQNGQEVLAQFDKRGNMRVVPGLAPRPQKPLVTVGGDVMEREESKGYGKYLIDSVLKPAEERAFAATKARQAVDAMRRLKVKTGKLAPAATEAAAWVTSLGGDPKQFGLDNPATAQSFTAIGQQVVLDRQMAQKGPQTENDAKRLEQTFAKLGNTPEANEFIMDVTEAQAKRDQDYRNFLLSYRRKRGSLDGAQEEWESGPGVRSIFDDPTLKKWIKAAETTQPRLPAPPSAIEYLRANNTPEMRQQFKAKYGYLPE